LQHQPVQLLNIQMELVLTATIRLSFVMLVLTMKLYDLRLLVLDARRDIV